MPGQPEQLGRLRAALASRYRLQRELGHGGMATVYLAEDLKHDRKVAVKVLKPELAAAVGADRFLREIRVTARLNHPHILPLLDSGEADGLLYYVMPYVEGESLRQRLVRERELRIDQALQITREVADALAHAHGVGVIHRDIKPENILLAGGHALVTDFGIARARGALDNDTLTETGQSLGTPAYMSPEQATAGRDVDGRTDLYSLGAVLYEMLTGEPPFTGKTAQAIIARLMTDRPTPVRTFRDAVPESIERVVMRSLAKVPADRWSSATEFARVLKLEQSTETAVTAAPRPRVRRRTRRRAALGGALAALLLVGFSAVLVSNRQGRRVVAVESPDAVAVLPFNVRGAALTEWREGVVDLLSTALDGAGGLRAINSRTVLARWNELVPDTADADERVALEVARRTGARYALLGSAVALGGEVRLVAQVRDLQEGRRLGQVQADGSPDEVLALMDRLAVRTLGLILPSGRVDLPRVDLASITTPSVPALKAYLEGESLLRAGEFKGAIEAFERALEGDSLFALAYYGLFRAATFEYGVNSPLRIESRQRAFELIDRLPERKALLIRLSMEWFDPGRDFPEKVLRPLEAAVVRYPEDAELWHELAEARLWVLESVGNWESVEQPLRRAVEIAPRFAPYWIHLIELTLVHDGDSAVVAQLIANYESVSADSRRVKLFRIAADLIHGDSAHRARALERLDELGTDGIADYELLFYLSSPRQWPSYSEALEALYRHGSRDDKIFARLRQAKRVVLARGRLRDGSRYLEDPIVPASEARKLLYWLSMHRIPIPAERIAALGPFEVERATADEAFLFGVYAADHGQWAAHQAAMARLKRLADSLTGAGRSGRWPRSVSWALESRALWSRGRTEEALTALRDTLQDLQLDIYLWAGRMSRETGRYEQAARHYAHFMLWRADPLVSYELGQVYEVLGDRQRAREAYQLFVDTWAEADPEFQPLVADARRRLGAVG